MAALVSKLSKSDLDSLIALAIKNANEFPNKDSRILWLLRTAIVQKQAGHIEDSLRNLQTVRDAVMNDEITKTYFYNLADDLASALVEAGNASDAIPLADKMANHGGKENVLHTIACTQARMGHIPGAKSTLSWMDTEPGRVGALECIGMDQAEQGDFQGALETAARIWQEPHQTLGRGSKEGAHDLVLGQIAIAEAKRGQLDDALEIATKLSIRDQVESLIAFGLRLGDDGYPSCNKSVLDRAYSLATSKPQSERDYCGKSSLNDLAIAQADCRYWPEALKSASAMNESYDRALTTQYLAYWQAKLGDWHDVVIWADQEDGAYSRANAFIGIAGALLGMDPPLAHAILSIA